MWVRLQSEELELRLLSLILLFCQVSVWATNNGVCVFVHSPSCSVLANVGRSNIYRNRKDYTDVRNVAFLLLAAAFVIL